jgi:hypothetical protein
MATATLGCTITSPNAVTIPVADLRAAGIIDANNKPTGTFNKAKLEALAKNHGVKIVFQTKQYNTATHKEQAVNPATWTPAMNTSLIPPGLRLPKGNQTIVWNSVVKK